jgi:hypothetical protein
VGGIVRPKQPKTKNIYPPALGDRIEMYPVYRGSFLFLSRFGRIVPRENGLKSRFFSVLRRFIFVFGWRKLFQKVNSPLRPNPVGDRDDAPKEIGTVKTAQKTRRTNIAL